MYRITIQTTTGVITHYLTMAEFNRVLAVYSDMLDCGLITEAHFTCEPAPLDIERLR